MAPELADVVGARVSALAEAMRAAGARVGVGELLAAHRALAAVDPASREDAFYALRAALCSTRAELDLFATVFALVFATAADPLDDPLQELGEIRRAATPRSAMAVEGEDGAPQIEKPVPAAYSDEELLRHKDFAEYSDAERATRAAAADPHRRPRAAARQPPHAADPPPP